MLEAYGFYFLVLGGLLIAAGFVGLLIRAARTRTAWFLACLLFPPSAVAFAALHFRRVRRPLAVMAVGAAVIAGTYGTNYYVSHHLALGPREKLVDGDLHITLTGWDRDDYALLETRPQTVVLQMANPDVDDQTLEHLRGLKQLAVLDLSSSQVSDAGLRLLGELPALRVLRLRGTKITDAGFRQYLADMPALEELDVRDTGVASNSLRAWKSSSQQRRRFLR